MRAAEAEKLLRRIADGEGGRGGGARRSSFLPRRNGKGAPDATRASSDVAAGGSVAVATAEAAEALVPASSGGASTHGARPGPKITTAAEDTYRYRPVRRRRWRWVMVLLALAVSVPTSVVLWYANRTPPASPPPDNADPVVLTAGMGVQACAAQSADRESDVPDGGPARPGEYSLLAGWTYFRDPSGFRLAVPQTWRMSRIGELRCFRDPSSPRAIGVLDHGSVSGDPLQLLADGERAWRDEAGISDYRRLGLTDAHYDEGAADLEYTFRSRQTVLHGMSRMLRLDGRVFTLFWLTTDFNWSGDQTLLNFLQPSFELT